VRKALELVMPAFHDAQVAPSSYEMANCWPVPVLALAITHVLPPRWTTELAPPNDSRKGMLVTNSVHDAPKSRLRYRYLLAASKARTVPSSLASNDS
jgi:hypothetical protein